MNKGEVICPVCISAGELIDKRNGKRTISTCDFCHGTGYVPRQVSDDFLLSTNEYLTEEDLDE